MSTTHDTEQPRGRWWGGALWTLATGSGSAGVFTGLCAVGGLAYLIATAWFARRS